MCHPEAFELLSTDARGGSCGTITGTKAGAAPLPKSRSLPCCFRHMVSHDRDIPYRCAVAFASVLAIVALLADRNLCRLWLNPATGMPGTVVIYVQLSFVLGTGIAFWRS